MTIQAAKQKATKEFFRSVQESDGFCPREADDGLNDSSRNLINEMAKHYGKVYLGCVNLYGHDRKKTVTFREYPDGEIVCNFAASFVLPTDDDQLKRMIEQRDQDEYTGTTDDAVRVDAIHARIEELEGYQLIWS